MQEFKIRKDLPKALTSGERQVRTDLSEIEHFHKWRYEQAKAFVPDGVTVLDLGCGVGYGSFMLSEKNVTVTGVDDSAEAIQFANTHYKRPNISYRHGDIFKIRDRFDYCVAFEIMEHNPDPVAFFDLLERVVDKGFILSVPHDSIPVEGFPFHYRHYKKEEVEELVRQIGFTIFECSLPVVNNGVNVLVKAVRQ